MLAQNIIARKRDGFALSQEEVEQFVSGVVSGVFTDYQATALLMAIVLKGMSVEETKWLTEAVMRSGRIIELPEISRPKVDKHSTGGVGDKVSLILAPLAVGNSLEVMEAIECLQGRGPADLMEVSYALVAEMLVLGGICESPGSAQEGMEAAIADGRAWHAFRELVRAQGGDLEMLEARERLPRAKEQEELCYRGERPAYLSALDALAVGEAARLLGAGRANAESKIDLTVGFVFQKKPGDPVQPGEPLAVIHYNDSQKLESARKRLLEAFDYTLEKPELPARIIDRLSEA